MKRYFVTFLIVLMTSCAPILVNYDYDRQVDFNAYKTYQYYADIDTGLSELDTKRLLDAIDAQMASKGFSISENPDFFIDIKSTEFYKPQQSAVGVGLGGGGRNMGGGISIGIPVGQSNANRQLTIDFVDENKKQLFWQAVSEFSFTPSATPEAKETLFNTVTEKILSEYPPNQ